jgi:hypothetical protein
MKAKILKIGKIEKGLPVDWIFDGGNAMMEIDMKCKLTYGGYTIEELTKIINTQTRMIEIRHREVIGTENVTEEQFQAALDNVDNKVVEIYRDKQSYKQRLLELQRKLNRKKSVK